MLSGHDLVCLSLTPWETELPSTAHYLMREFARCNRVLFVDHPLTLKDLWTRRGDPREAERIRRTLSRSPALRPVTDPERQIWVLTPPPAPPSQLAPRVYDASMAIAATATRRAIRHAMAEIGMKRPLFWVAFDVPLGAHLVGTLGERLAIYLCYDEIAAEPYVARHGVRLESRLLERSDVVLATSRALHVSRGARHPDCHWVPNGVEVDHYRRALDPDLPVAEELLGLPHPVLGYLGHLESRVDYALLAGVAAARPDWTLVLVGPVSPEYRRQVEALDAMPNLRVLGPKTVAQAPSYLKGFDVALIPFVHSPQTRAIYPLKLNEYLAAGRPVVMTSFATLPEFADVCRVADGVEGTVEAIAQALLEDGPELHLARLACARTNSWEARATAISRLLVERLIAQNARAYAKEAPA